LTRQRVWDGGNGGNVITIDEDGDVEELGKDGKDKWIPEPQMGEKREARTVRGWVWPSDPWHRGKGSVGKEEAVHGVEERMIPHRYLCGQL